MKNSRKTRKNGILLSLGIVFATAIYLVSQYMGNTSTSIASTVPSSSQPSLSQKSKQVSGNYKNGTYTGGSADAYYGTVQVQAVIQNGALASVHILQYPNSHSTSVYINDQAMPMLVNEAIQAQNANVNIVSGATFTSQAFQQSLGSALSQA